MTEYKRGNREALRGTVARLRGCLFVVAADAPSEPGGSLKWTGLACGSAIRYNCDALRQSNDSVQPEGNSNAPGCESTGSDYLGLTMESHKGPGDVFRYCTKCGAAAVRAVGSKLLRCEACGFELFLNPAASVAGVIVDGQARMVVLVRGREPGKGQWDLPGGFVDPGETAEEALRREVREEVGLEVSAMRYLGSWPNTYEYGGVPYRTLDLGFLCEARGAERAKPVESEVERVLLVSFAEIDLGRFAFRSVAQIAGAYLEDVHARRPPCS